MASNQLRNLPSVERVANHGDLADLVAAYGRGWVVELARNAVSEARQRVLAGAAAPSETDIVAVVRDAVIQLVTPSPRPVINATGVIIHTNLGRAPLSNSAIAAAENAAKGYSDLEIDLETGRRGSRQAHLQSLLRNLTGAEAAFVVNNNASALLLGLSALAAGREVIVTRGEAVEIGGGFRIPDVLRQSGCTLVDVGTTNRTYIRDYADAVTEHTGAFLKAHASNFRVEGFTAGVDERDLVELGAKTGIPVLHDVGSGAILATERYGLAHEPTPQESIAAGVGLVFFSGDKLLGGPQAGIVVGKKELVSQMERHPLARAVRIDKMSLASLTATLIHFLSGDAESKVPVWRMIDLLAQDGHQAVESRLAVHRQSPEDGPADQHSLGAQGQGLDHVRAAADTAIQQYLHLAIHRLDDLRKDFDSSQGRVQVARAVVRHHDAVHTVLRGQGGVLARHQPLEDDGQRRLRLDPVDILPCGAAVSQHPRCLGNHDALAQVWKLVRSKVGVVGPEARPAVRELVADGALALG